MKSLFISKELSESSPILSWSKERKIKVYDKSFLTFELQPSVFPEEEVFFFTSKRAVTYFLQQHTIPKEIKIACVGQATAEELEKLGLSVDFIGKTSGNPKKVAQELKHHYINQSIAFIGALEGSDSIYNEFDSQRVNKYVVYKTIVIPFKIEEVFDYYVFTSPSNLEGYLALNSLPQNAKVIAWGKTTEKALNKYSINPCFTLENATEKELVGKLIQDFS